MAKQQFSKNKNSWQSGQIRFSAKLTELAQRSWFRYCVALFLIFIVAIFALIVLNKISPEKQNPDNSIADQQALERVRELEQALKNDTVGGKTPEQTMQLFLEALKAGNMNLAAQYFAIDTNEKSVYYLTRQQWLDALNYKQQKGEIGNIIATIEKMVPSKDPNLTDNTYAYVLLNSNGLAEYSLFLKFNEYSKIWKIESL